MAFDFQLPLQRQVNHQLNHRIRSGSILPTNVLLSPALNRCDAI